MLSRAFRAASRARAAVIAFSRMERPTAGLSLIHILDYVAASFVSTAQDMRDLREFLDANGGKDIDIIAKIENRSGVDNARAILDYCEGIMVARGDLGVEIPYEELPPVQKRLIRICLARGKVVITATEMLESMTEKPRPTRAEISDVAKMCIRDRSGGHRRDR